MFQRNVLGTFSIVILIAGAVACSGTSDNTDAGGTADSGPGVDSGTPDGGLHDGGHDAGSGDAGHFDGGQGDGGQGDGGQNDGGDCGGESASCNTVTQIADVVQEQQVASDAPAPQGGTFVAGTYKLTAITLYTGTGGATGPSGHSEQTTVEASGSGSTRTVQIVNTRDCGITRQTLELTFSGGTEFSSNAICPSGCTDCGGTLSYTATATTFSFFENHNGNARLMQFTKQ